MESFCIACTQFLKIHKNNKCKKNCNTSNNKKHDDPSSFPKMLTVKNDFVMCLKKMVAKSWVRFLIINTYMSVLCKNK